jgi:hypothetical protein
MAKLSGTTTAMRPPAKKKSKGKKSGPIVVKKTNPSPSGLNTLGVKSELFMTAISTFAGEDTFYESGQARIDRIRQLVHDVVAKDPEWVQRFVPWLRGPEVNIRTISLIIAAEYVAAGGPNGSSVIDSACQRADEPAEILAYWMQTYYGWDTQSYPLPSPKLPQALRKGLSRAVIRLYNEYSVLKYDGNSRGVGMSEVLNLVHPAVSDYPTGWDEDRIKKQRAIFRYIIDREYDNEPKLKRIPMIGANIRVRSMTPDDVRALSAEQLQEAGITWEQYGGYLGGPFDALAWEKMIPNMGYMALLRNLRNFEGAGISATSRNVVVKRLSDPDEVARSRQLPFRFLSAYKQLNSSAYLQALEDALNLSVKNLPEFEGRTLVLVDKSGSMDATLSEKSSVARWEVGALFASALKLNGASTDLAIFGDSSKRMEFPKGTSILRGIEHLRPNHGVGHGTNIWGSARSQYDNHSRIVIFTDMQDNRSSHGAIRDLASVPYIHFFNTAGYRASAAPSNAGDDGRFYYGGFSDATFKMMLLLEESNKAGWPF